MTSGQLPVPDFGGGSLADVLPAVVGELGVSAGVGRTGVLDIPTGTRVCLLLIDGLGAVALGAHAAAAPFLTSMRGQEASRTVTSVFPSTTPVALTSLGTGLPPGEHGITGLFLRLPEDGRVVNTLAIPAQADMRRLQPRPTLFERAAEAGVAVTRVGPRAFDGQGLTEAALRGGGYSGAETVGELIEATVQAASRPAPSLTYAYVSTLDATGHRRGCTSPAWLRELTHIDRLVEQLATALPAGVGLVVTSDHGMVDVPRSERWDLATTPTLDDGVEALAGDPRGLHVHTRAGAAADVLQSWREVLGDAFWMLSREEAVAAGLFGPAVSVDVTARIGNIVAAARGTGAVVDSRRPEGAMLSLVGLHGSVTPEELIVPLLVRPA